MNTAILYRVQQDIPVMKTGYPCNENRILAMKTGHPCNENRIPAMKTGFLVMKTGAL
jgi:hypothetical protein